ncbi:nucleoside-diphosphate kinase [candidate division WOR-3 bacterium]|nr:nucleoside-diphosphate kinase [candidate division WOR-3 bacterium]
MKRTLVIIKPNAVQRELIGEIITRFEKRGLKIIALKLVQITTDMAVKHYREHEGKDFYESLISFITSGPSVAMILEGENVIEVVRKMCGATDPMKAEPGTIRGDLGMRIRQNIIHASDSDRSSSREIEIFFKADEIIEYKLATRSWI